MSVTNTQVGIIGAGPAGLVLSHILARAGIDAVVLEDRSREHVEHRVRAGVLEQGTVDLLDEMGLSARLRAEGLVHHGILIGLDGRRYRIPLSDLTGGRAITVYGQQELVKDLVAARLAGGGAIEFEVQEVGLSGLDTKRPAIRYRKGGRACELRCDFVAGCDGFHGVSRGSIAPGVLRVYERRYPFAWLGILAAVAPSTDELIYARHERGFALHSLRSPTVSRLYIQVDPSAALADWPDNRVWQELQLRLGTNDGWTLTEGPVLEKSIALHHSFVIEPMQHGRLFLAGDAAHIVPPTGAKGLNLAVADVRLLARAITRWYRTGQAEELERYSERCLNRVWRVQEFSSWMSGLLHRLPDSDPFDDRIARARLGWICRSEAEARSL
ncbi:MAG TPA: 4-hydroxybenzoate 3-monooxygenase, partial [Tepidisphaeraceae bacterium]